VPLHAVASPIADSIEQMTTVCVVGNSLHYPEQLWPYLNWALSLRGAGCEVIWLEGLEDEPHAKWLDPAVAALHERLEPYGLGDALALVSADGAAVDPRPSGTLPYAAALEADLLLDLGYLPPEQARRFRRSVFVDLDPGQAQLWIAAGEIDVSGHDVHISIGEGVEAPDRPFPDGGYRWIYVPTPVALDAWRPGPPPGPDAAYTTISHWWESEDIEIGGEWVENSKRAGFEPFLGVPSLVSAPLELALGGLEDDDERQRLERLGWSVRDAESVVATPRAYMDYVRASRGEFTAAKPPYVQLRSGWLNDRTASYLAAGRPAIVERTIDQRHSRLPDDEGLVRFTSLEDAAAAVEAVEADYERHARSARRLAEERFDGIKIAGQVLELALA
jgi:hypothetical protein